MLLLLVLVLVRRLRLLLVCLTEVCVKEVDTGGWGGSGGVVGEGWGVVAESAVSRVVLGCVWTVLVVVVDVVDRSCCASATCCCAWGACTCTSVSVVRVKTQNT